MRFSHHQEMPRSELPARLPSEGEEGEEGKNDVEILRQVSDAKCFDKLIITTYYSSEDDDDRPQHQYYYVKAKYTASYEAILPISTNSQQQDINSEECFEFMCVPLVDEPDPDYSEEDKRALARCTEPKCPRGYMIRLQIQKDSNQCAKYVYLFARTGLSVDCVVLKCDKQF